MVHKIARDKKYYDETTYGKDLKALDMILKDASMSQDLKNAIMELKNAMQRKDYNLAYELSAVKSLIAGVDSFKEEKKFRIPERFLERNKFNERKLGESLYSYLDALHHKITFNMMRSGKDVIPSGMMVISAGGIRQKSPSKLESPTLKLMNMEQKRIEKEASKGKY